MASRPLILQHLRTLHAQRPALLWLLAFMVVVKSAVPLFAVEAARMRGVPVADVCEVHGVRLPMAQGDSSGQADPARPASSRDKEHCALSWLLGSSVVVARTLAAALPHAPQPLPCPPRVFSFAPHDAGLAWLVAQLHAPPPSV